MHISSSLAKRIERLLLLLLDDDDDSGGVDGLLFDSGVELSMVLLHMNRGT